MGFHKPRSQGRLWKLLAEFWWIKGSLLTLQETITYPTFGKGKSSSTQSCLESGWYVSSLEGMDPWLFHSLYTTWQYHSLYTTNSQGMPRFWSLLKCDRSDIRNLTDQKISLGDLVVVARLLEDFAWGLVSSINSFLFPFPKCPQAPHPLKLIQLNPTFAPATVRRRWWSISCRPLSTWHWVASLRGISWVFPPSQ